MAKNWLVTAEPLPFLPCRLKRSSIWGKNYSFPLAAYPQVKRCGQHLPAYMALLRAGFASQPRFRCCWWSLTPPLLLYQRFLPGSLVSVALSVGSLRPPFQRHPALRSSDFPHPMGAIALPALAEYICKEHNLLLSNLFRPPYLQKEHNKNNGKIHKIQ